MKKVIAGFGFLFFGVLLYLAASIVGSISMQYTTSWQTNIGRYWQTVINCGMMPAVVIGIIFIVAGLALMLWGVFAKDKDKE